MPLACEVRRPQVLPPRKPILDTSLVFYAPLWHPGLAISPFLSKNPGAVHTCTVTGALWTPQGRSFDGNDDKIDCGNSVALQLTTTISTIFWYKPIAYATNEDGRIYRKIENLGGSNRGGYSLRLRGIEHKLEVLFGINTTAYEGLSTVGTYSLDSFICVGMRRNGSSCQLLVNGEIVATISTLGASWNNAPNTNLDVGSSATGGVCVIGEGLVSNRYLAVGEFMDNYLATKWRYR